MISPPIEQWLSRLALSTTATWGAVAVFSFLAHTAFAAAPGAKLWEFEAGGEIHSSPAIAPDGTIYFGSRDHRLYALTPAGKKKWEFLASQGIDAAPAIGADGTIYVGSIDNTFYAVSPDGTKRWQFVTGSSISVPAALGPDGSVYVVSGDGNLYALAANGSKKWQFSTGGPMSAAAVARDGTVYVGHHDGHFYALNPDGSQKWKFRIRTSDNLDGILGSSPVLDEEGTIYFLSLGRGLTGFFADQWLGIRPDGTKAIALRSSESFDSALVVGQGNTIYGGRSGIAGSFAARAPNGDLKWKAQLALGGFSAEPTGAPAVASDGTVYIGLRSGNTSALAALGNGGSVAWTFETFGQILSGPAIGTNGTVYFGSTDRKLYAVAGSTGPGSAPWPMFRGNTRHTGALPPATFDHVSLGVNVYAGVVINGNVGSTFRVEAQDRLGGAWIPVGTVVLDRSPYLFFDVGSTNYSKRFYRAVLLP